MGRAAFRCLVMTFTVLAYISICWGGEVLKPNVISPSQVKWVPVKGLPGVEMAVLWGDPDKTGSQYAIRYKIAGGVKDPPHWHASPEQATVISGTYLLGYGDKMDPAKMVPMTAGSFVAVPAGVHHYGVTKGETIIEAHGVGPYTMTLVK